MMLMERRSTRPEKCLSKVGMSKTSLSVCYRETLEQGSAGTLVCTFRDKIGSRLREIGGKGR